MLAVLSVVGGFMGWPAALGGSNHFEHFLAPVFANPGVPPSPHYAHSVEYVLMLVSVLVASAGIFLAYQFYVKNPEFPRRLAASARTVYTVLANRYYVDELYDVLFVNRLKNLGNGLAAFDLGVVDGGVNGSAWLTRKTAEGSRRWDIWVIDGLINAGAFAIRLMSYPVRMVQTGLVQSYALLIVLGLLAFAAYYIFR
jgi:NADH-quinone oxidoreductase subunit L